MIVPQATIARALALPAAALATPLAHAVPSAASPSPLPSLLPWLLAAIGWACVFALLIRVARDRAKLHNRGLLRPWPIPTIEPGALHPALATDHLGPSLDSLVAITPSLNVPGGISELESCILCALARHTPAAPASIFEFGTCTGKTTYLLALNARRGDSGDPARDLPRIATLTLAPTQRDTYVRAKGDDPRDTRAALKESAFTRFYYSGTPVEPAITQLFGDSKAFDPAPDPAPAPAGNHHLARYDLIFVDGSHARSYVESDSRLALRMVKPGGIIAWHDYRGPWRARGVWSTLNRLARELPLQHVKGTSLVVYRAPK